MRIKIFRLAQEPVLSIYNSGGRIDPNIDSMDTKSVSDRYWPGEIDSLL